MHIVVVGAGILGASTAYHAARLGAEVTVVDQAHEGRATAAGAGIICPWVSGGRVSGVRLADETIAADCVVVAAGAWAPALLRPVGVNLPIEPQRGQIVHLQLPGADTRDWPVILSPGSNYMLAFDDSRVAIGATREAGVGFDYRVTAAGQAEILAEALHVAPGLASATIIETRVGFRPVGPGIRPLLGYAGGLEGLLIGNGLGAAGLTIGPFAGMLLADAALGREPMLDLTPFDPIRRSPRVSGGEALR